VDEELQIGTNDVPREESRDDTLDYLGFLVYECMITTGMKQEEELHMSYLTTKPLSFPSPNPSCRTLAHHAIDQPTVPKVVVAGIVSRNRR
jgi:hypothetical protein